MFTVFWGAWEFPVIPVSWENKVDLIFVRPLTHLDRCSHFICFNLTRFQLSSPVP